MLIYWEKYRDIMGIKWVCPKIKDVMDISWGYMGIWWGVHGDILTYMIWVRLQMRDSTFNKQAQGFLAMSGNGGTDPQSRPYCRKTNENAAVSSKTWCIWPFKFCRKSTIPSMRMPCKCGDITKQTRMENGGISSSLIAVWLAVEEFFTAFDGFSASRRAYRKTLEW